MRAIFSAVIGLSLLSLPVQAGPLEDSQALFMVVLQGSKDLSDYIGILAPSVATADEMQTTLYDPVVAARATWLENGQTFGAGDDNPYLPFMSCSDAADELVYGAVEIMRFQRGMDYSLVKFEHTRPLIAALQLCADALAEASPE